MFTETNYEFITKMTKTQGHSLDTFKRVKNLFPNFVTKVFDNMQKYRYNKQDEYNHDIGSDNADVYVFLMSNIKKVELYYADLKTEIDTYIEGCKLESLRGIIQTASILIEIKKHFKIQGIKSSKFLHFLYMNKTKIDQIDDSLKEFVDAAILNENRDGLQYLLNFN